MRARDGVFVPFGSLHACTLKAPAWLARQLDLPVYASFAVRTSGDRFRWIISPAIEVVHSGDEERDIEENTARFTAVVESAIRRFPDQWMAWYGRTWVHPFLGESDYLILSDLRFIIILYTGEGEHFFED